MKELFPAQRVCVVCGYQTPSYQMKLPPGQPPTLGLYVTIYRRARGGRQLSGSGKVNVCEPCLLKIAAEGHTYRAAGRRLADALLSAIVRRVEAMCDRESAPRKSKASLERGAA